MLPNEKTRNMSFRCESCKSHDDKQDTAPKAENRVGDFPIGFQKFPLSPAIPLIVWFSENPVQAGLEYSVL